MTCSDEDHDRSRRPGAEDRRWSNKSVTRWQGDREVGWHCVRSVPCTWRWEARVSWLSLKTKVDGLLRFGLKTGGSDFPVWVSKPVATVWWFRPQNHRDVSWFEPQNQAGFGLSVAPQNRRREDSAEHMLRSGGLLRLEAWRTRVSQSGLKTDGGTTVGGARGNIAEGTSGSSWRRSSRCDGLRRTLLPLFYHFLCIRPYMHSSHLVFYLDI
jgi:hypothetical protein